MGVVIKPIVLEDILKEVLSYIPSIKSLDGKMDANITFGFGSDKELELFLSNRKSTNVYPIIWLVYPYSETHNITNLTAENLTLIIAVDSNASMENKDRIELTFKKLLIPIFGYLKEVFKKANVITVLGDEEPFKVTKYPNYSKTDAKDETKVSYIWDALKVECGIRIVDTCIKPIKI